MLQRFLYFSFFCAILTSVIFSACNADQVDSNTNDVLKFQKIESDQSGLNFQNVVENTPELNALVFETYYNGGGVGIGDFDQDGLLDVYLGGNQVADKLFRNKGNLKFEDLTESSGILDRGGWTTGVSVADVNNDGWPDIYVCKSLLDAPELRVNELYINLQNGKFEEQATKYGIADAWRSQQANFLDFDRDGDLDLFLVNQPPNPGPLSPLKGQDWRDPALGCRFFENIGNKFVDKSIESGLSHGGYPLSAAIGDFNNDGWQDIYVAHDYNSPDAFFINQKNKTFTNQIHESFEHISFFAMGSDFGDLNNDGWQDLIVLDMAAESHFRNKANMGGMDAASFYELVKNKGHHQYMFNTLQLNQGIDKDQKLKFGDIAQLANLSNTDWSWAPLIADFNNDGNQDIFITNGVKHDLRYTDGLNQIKEKVRSIKSADKNISQQNILSKVDALDLLNTLPSTPLENYLYSNDGALGFKNVAAEIGLDQKTFSSGAAYADLDNDGDLDLVVNNLDDFTFLYENKSSGNYISFELKCPKELNPIGTEIEIVGKDFKQVQQLANARGFYSTSQNRIHFGLGNNKNIEKVNITWSNGTAQTITNPKVNRLVKIDYAGKMINQSMNQIAVGNLAEKYNLSFSHVENDFNDFDKQVLLPHKLSQFGPALEIGDVNNDGLDDIFIGGSSTFPATLFVQKNSGKFEKSNEQLWKNDQLYEDVDALFLDIDLDGDQDLYVVSGGNEFPSNSKSYQDRVYINDGKGVFSKAVMLPENSVPGSKVKAADFDGDGDLDLFVGARHEPGKYPFPTTSQLLVNQTKETGATRFLNQTDKLAPVLNKMGLVTDARWLDIDNDQDEDLIVVGEWMSVHFLINEEGVFKDQSKKYFPEPSNGWWFAIEPYDFDSDGDMDILVGNLGENYKYQKTEEEDFKVFFGDFDDNGQADIVLSEQESGIDYPVRGRSCSSEQIPDIKKKFINYKSFASASIQDIYGEKLEENQTYEIDIFQSGILVNDGSQSFSFQPFPSEGQISNINDFLPVEINNQKTIVAATNFYGAEVETPRADAARGFLIALEENKMIVKNPQKTGMYLNGQISNIEELKINGKSHLLAIPNNGELLLYATEEIKN